MLVLTTTAPALELAWTIVISGVTFCYLWYLDHQTHLNIWKTDIQDGELRTHRMILYASYGLALGLLLMVWFKWFGLCLFLASFLTRLVQESIDEFVWHRSRCTERETLLHLGMWVSVYVGSFSLGIWGVFFDYRDFWNVPTPLHLGMLAIAVTMGIIGHREMNDYAPEHR